MYFVLIIKVNLKLFSVTAKTRIKNYFPFCQARDLPKTMSICSTKTLSVDTNPC
uniref:Uncharacterized protein n=1 Tax=Meloidogyne enterolobii TaxID=390850 RepID=A0A6V7URG6_MELEN|nr:unnamed protein product [Meloidogyne enterolobii]